MTTPPTTTASPTGRPAYTQTLPCAPQSAQAARRLVRTVLGIWEMDDLADAATLLVSELVGNAVRHTRCRQIRVTVDRTAQHAVRIGVTDRSHGRPVLRQPEDDEMCGRCLLVVEALAARWGTDPLPWGKRVWFELAHEADT